MSQAFGGTSPTADSSTRMILEPRAASHEEAVALLEQLVRIPSVSGDEAAAAHWLVGQMQTLGFDAYVDEVGNAVGEIGAGHPETVLLGHIDTVPGNVPVRIEADRLYGRGAVDAKGPLATFVVAAARLAARPDFRGRIVVIGCVEEEAPSSRGAHAVVERYAPDACIVGEPSGWERVTIGYKGTLRLRCATTVPCGHSAHDRETAVEQLVSWWQQLRAITKAHNAGQSRAFDQLQPSLLQLNSTSDGLEERAQAEVGIRLPLGIDPAAFASTLHRLDERVAIEVLGATPAFQAAQQSPLIRAFNGALRGYGLRPRLVLKTGTADMNIVGPAWGCPTVAYGPGDAALDHTPHEHIVVSDYVRAIGVLETALAEIHCASHGS